MSDQNQPNDQTPPSLPPVENKPELTDTPVPLMKTEPVIDETKVEKVDEVEKDDSQIAEKPVETPDKPTITPAAAAPENQTPADETFTISAVSSPPTNATPAQTPTKPSLSENLPPPTAITSDQPVPAADVTVSSLNQPPPKKKSPKMAGILIAILFIALTIPAAVFLVKNNQDVRQQAAVGEMVPKFINCLSGDSCIPDHSEPFCDKDGFLCTYHVGECGYEPANPCTPNPPGPGTGCKSDYYCRPYDNVCIYKPGTPDLICEWKSRSNCKKDASCGVEEPAPTPTPLPSPTPRPDLCVSLTISDNTLAPGDTTTFTATTSSLANNFYFRLYNNDNLYPENGTARPICITTGGDVNTFLDTCPAGTYHLVYKDPNTSSRTTGSRTLTYDQIFVQDQNWNNQVPQHVGVMANMSIGDGPLSIPVPQCVRPLNQAFATPLPTPTPAPSPTPSPTPPPVGAQCVAVKIYTVTGDINDPQSWVLLTNAELAQLQPGNIIYVTTLGTVSNGIIDKARIRVNSSVWSVDNETTLKKPQSDEFYISYTIPSDGTTNFSFGAEIHEANTDKWF